MSHLLVILEFWQRVHYINLLVYEDGRIVWDCCQLRNSRTPAAHKQLTSRTPAAHQPLTSCSPNDHHHKWCRSSAPWEWMCQHEGAALLCHTDAVEGAAVCRRPRHVSATQREKNININLLFCVRFVMEKLLKVTFASWVAFSSVKLSIFQHERLQNWYVI